VATARRTLDGMRYLFTTQPGTGHLHPLLPVARALQAAGHEVAVATSAPMGPAIRAAGFAHHAVGRSWLTTDMPREFPEIATIPPGPERYAWARRQIFAHDVVLDAVPDLLRVGACWGPHAIVRDAADYGGSIAAELLGIPQAVVRTDSGSSSYAERGHVADVLDVVRAHVGLPPDPAGEAPFRDLVLSFAPPGLDDAADLAPTCVQLRPPAPDQDARDAAPSWFADVVERAPVVYATLGTVYNSPELLAAIVTGLAFEPIEVVVTTAGRELPGPLPPNVHVEPWIPQDAVLPHCAAVVSHGGYGTASAALGHGLPMVLLPISADQPMNASRLAAAGVGITLDAGARSPGAIRAATRTVLDDARYRATAARLAAEARGRPGIAHAVGLLEALAATGCRPLTRGSRW
jgi:UDP:flavonoid glycosyltransferase YjiC (YdhE family)